MKYLLLLIFIYLPLVAQTRLPEVEEELARTYNNYRQSYGLPVIEFCNNTVPEIYNVLKEHNINNFRRVNKFFWENYNSPNRGDIIWDKIQAMGGHIGYLDRYERIKKITKDFYAKYNVVVTKVIPHEIVEILNPTGDLYGISPQDILRRSLGNKNTGKGFSGHAGHNAVLLGNYSSAASMFVSCIRGRNGGIYITVYFIDIY